MSGLATVDLEAVEILAVGGPVHGKGSPPGGDYWSKRDLEQIARANRELADEVKPPAKIGHGSDQPAVGWLDNMRVSSDGTRLLADIKRVPKTFAELVKTGTYRTRSVELSRVTSQKTGRKYDWVVSGLAWLGGTVPAVRGLADVFKLYAGSNVQLVRAYEFHAPARVSSELVGRAQDAYERARRLERQFHERDRNELVDRALREGRVAKEDREYVEAIFDADPSKARRFVDSREPNEELVRAFEDDQVDASVARAFEEELARTMGVKVEDLI